MKTIVCAMVLLSAVSHADDFWLRPDVGYHSYRQRFVFALTNDLFRTVYVTNDLLAVANVHGDLIGARPREVFSDDSDGAMLIDLFHISATPSQCVAGSVITSVQVIDQENGVNQFGYSHTSVNISLRGIGKSTSNGIEIVFSGDYIGEVVHFALSALFATRRHETGYDYPFYGSVEVGTNGTIVTPLKVRRFWEYPGAGAHDERSFQFMSLVEMPSKGADYAMLAHSISQERMDLISFSNGKMSGVSTVLTKPAYDKRYRVPDTYICWANTGDWLFFNMTYIDKYESESPWHVYNFMSTNSFGTTGMTFHNVNSVLPLTFYPCDYQFRDGRCFVVGADTNGIVLCAVSLVDHRLQMTTTRVPATSSNWQDFLIVPAQETNCMLILERTTGTVWRTALRHSYP